MRRALCLGIAVGILVLVLGGGGSGAAYDVPALRPGDFWAYRTNTSVSAGFSFAGTVTLTVVAREPHTIEGDPLDAYRMSVAGQGTASGTVATDFGTAPATGQWTFAGEELLETGGMKVVSSVLDLEANGTLHTEPAFLDFRLSVQNTTTLRLLEDGWRLPVDVGDSGEVRARVNFSEDFRLFYGLPAAPVHSEGLAWQNVSYVVEAREEVQVPAGRFDAFRVRRTFEDGTSIVSHFSPVAGNDVRSETRNESGSIGSAELVSYRYQAQIGRAYV